MPDPQPAGPTPLPCPYCKEAAVKVMARSKRLIGVICPSCEMLGPASHSPALAVAAWNVVAGLQGRVTEAVAIADDALLGIVCPAPGGYYCQLCRQSETYRDAVRHTRNCPAARLARLKETR